MRAVASPSASSRNQFAEVFPKSWTGLRKNCGETASQPVTKTSIPAIPYSWDNVAQRLVAGWKAMPVNDYLSRTEADVSTRTDKRKKKLQAFAKRRAQRPEPTVVPNRSLKVGHAVERRVVRNHADLLQNIEFALVNAASDAHEVDDQCIERILRHAITQKASEDPSINSALDSLAAIRRQREEDPGDLWSDALRVVYASLKRHSNCEPGETSYLHFVSQYVG